MHQRSMHAGYDLGELDWLLIMFAGEEERTLIHSEDIRKNCSGNEREDDSVGRTKEGITRKKKGMEDGRAKKLDSY
jgi:hypothetical protein